MELTTAETREIQSRLGPVVSELYPGLLDSPEGLLDEMFSFALEVVELEIEGGTVFPEPRRIAIDRLSLAVGVLTASSGIETQPTEH